MKPNAAAPAMIVSLGAISPAPAFAVGDVVAGTVELELVELEDEEESATWVTIVVVSGGTVVPGTVVAATVDTGFAVTPLGRL